MRQDLVARHLKHRDGAVGVLQQDVAQGISVEVAQPLDERRRRIEPGHRLIVEDQPLDAGERVGAVRAGDPHPGRPERRYGVGRARAGEVRGVDPAQAVDRVVARIAAERVSGVVAGDRIVARPADRVLDDDVESDREIAEQAPDVRVAPGAQVDPLVAGIAGEVERVGAGGIPDGDDRIQVDREIENLAPRVAVEAVDGVAGTRGRVGAVDRLDRRHVVKHRRRGIQPVGGCPVLLPAHTRPVAAEVGHDRVLTIVQAVLGVVGIGYRAAIARIVRARMAEAQRMADFVHVCLEAVAAVIHVVVGVVRGPVAVEPDLVARDAIIRRAVAVGPVAADPRP